MAAESREEKSRNMISSPGFCYSGLSSTSPNLQTHHLVTQIQGFEPSPELFNLTTGMDMLGFPSKNLQQREVNSGTWKGFFGKSIDLQGPSTSKTINEHESDFYQPDFSETTNDNLIVAPDMAWQESRLAVDDSSLRSVFPSCDGNDQPTRGLSLSLASNKPSSIGIQSFELKVTSHRHQHQHQHEQDDDIRFISSNSRDGFFGKFANIQQQQILQYGILGKAGDNLHQSNFEIKNSKYLAPAQELLNEFCGLGRKQTDTPKQKPRKSNSLEENGCGSSSRNQSLYTADLLELPKRKAKLLSMLEEVDRRYRHYCDQMKAVVSSFEMVAGNDAAKVYSALASKAMSRHFRCLRDGIVGQIRATKKAMGEKDPVAPGTTKGETPRLRLLDQTLRQQKALQQMNVLESHPWRPQRGLPERSVSVLRAWLFEHFLHPYPSDVDKHVLARQTGLSRSQVSNWFINARVRLWKPMVEEMYMEETKEQDNVMSSDGIPGLGDQLSPDQSHNLNSRRRHEDHKPTADQLARIDSECLSSIINNQENNDIKNDGNHQNRRHRQYQQQEQQLAPQDQQFGRVGNSFGVIDLDFSSYNPHTASTVSYSNGGAHQNFGSGVSLTLGLQQHGTSGVSLAFSPTSHHSLIFPRDHIEDCQPVHQYSILEGEGQNLPYRNLMGVQLLHDFAG